MKYIYNPINCCTPRFFKPAEICPCFSLCQIKQVQENKCWGEHPQEHRRRTTPSTTSKARPEGSTKGSANP